MSPYPAPIKTVLKIMPTCMTFGVFALAFLTLIRDGVYHPHDRIEKFFFKSPPFYKLVNKKYFR